MPPGDDGADLVAGYIARWRPSSVSPQAAAFARQVVPAAGPGGRERAKNLLWAAARLADYAIPLGLDPAPEVLLHPSVIERFTRCAPGPLAAAFAQQVVRRRAERRRTCCGRRPGSRLRDPARPGPGTGGAAAPVGDRAVHPVRAGTVRRGAADAAHEPAVHRPPGGAAAVPAGHAAAPGAGQDPLQPGGDRRVSRLGGRPAHPAAADAGRRADLPGCRRRADPRRPARRARHRRDLPVRRGDRGRRAAPGRGRCRCWPATTAGCWPRRRLPGPG